MGQAGESVISQWLRRKNWTILPVYEKILDTGKGPHLFMPEQVLIAPDLFAFQHEKAYWIEAKHKNAFSWFRKDQRWVTGIDLRHYQEYLKVDELTPWPVWLFFLQKGGKAKDSPEESPAGLFGERLEFLKNNENHRSDKWGNSGMVYWAKDKLRLLAPLCDVLPQPKPTTERVHPLFPEFNHTRRP